ncbi:MAG: hypothetical protein HLUCCA11_21805 [Phormidesmis priestleyi Ana]|uniref:Uncharacterized protein n=1 Tax=Phormidesmis priestleyi Ana TaxID=1666911 RepID=A0A0N8KLZ6_9CYAN|nr:MAG: hypothetical protein HLUCCA11_21805 [Phormidesmis priestleyi Ana]
MAGKKEFENKSKYQIDVIMVVRKSAQPLHTAGTETFSLNPGEKKWVKYGNDTDIYLNGLTLKSLAGGTVVQDSRITVQRGNKYDNLLNTNTYFDIIYDGMSFHVSGSNSAS